MSKLGTRVFLILLVKGLRKDNRRRLRANTNISPNREISLDGEDSMDAVLRHEINVTWDPANRLRWCHKSHWEAASLRQAASKSSRSFKLLNWKAIYSSIRSNTEESLQQQRLITKLSVSTHHNDPPRDGLLTILIWLSNQMVVCRRLSPHKFPVVLDQINTIMVKNWESRSNSSRTGDNPCPFHGLTCCKFHPRVAA